MSNTGILFLFRIFLEKSLWREDAQRSVKGFTDREQKSQVNKGLWAKRQLASTGTLPKKCKALWR